MTSDQRSRLSNYTHVIHLEDASSANANRSVFLFDTASLLSRAELFREHLVFVESLSLINMFYTIRSNNRYIYFTENGGATLFTATIPLGYYDEITFPVAVQAAMNAVVGIANAYIVTVDTALTLKVHFETVVPATTFELYAGDNDAYHELGFSSAGIRLGALEDYYSDGLIDLSGPKTLRVSIDKLRDITTTTDNHATTFVMPLTGGFGTFSTYDPQQEILMPLEDMALNNMRLLFEDEYGRALSFPTTAYLMMKLTFQKV